MATRPLEAPVSLPSTRLPLVPAPALLALRPHHSSLHCCRHRAQDRLHLLRKVAAGGPSQTPRTRSSSQDPSSVTPAGRCLPSTVTLQAAETRTR